jgi:hypothetical protein
MLQDVVCDCYKSIFLPEKAAVLAHKAKAVDIWNYGHALERTALLYYR